MLFNGYVCYGRFYLIMNIMWYLCCYRCIWDIHNKNLKKGKCEMRFIQNGAGTFMLYCRAVYDFYVHHTKDRHFQRSADGDIWHIINHR